MKPITFHEKAYQELQDTAQYYENITPGLGHLFLLATEQSLDEIASYPLAFQQVDTTVRHKNLHRFPYRLFYVVENSRLKILAVAHHKRKPGYWAQRC
jgi:plasmid stabilization system protein ParE